MEAENAENADETPKRPRKKREPGKAQKIAQEKYIKACHDMSSLAEVIKARGLTLHALNFASAWKYSKGNQSEDCMVRIWVKNEFRPLFTISIHNKILWMLRKYYDTVVLLKFTLIDSNGIVSEEKERDI